jgi:hypothetical protein
VWLLFACQVMPSAVRLGASKILLGIGAEVVAFWAIGHRQHCGRPNWSLCNHSTWPPWEIPTSCSPASSQCAPYRPVPPSHPMPGAHQCPPRLRWDAGAGLGGCRPTGRPPRWCGSSKLLPRMRTWLLLSFFFLFEGLGIKRRDLRVVCIFFVFRLCLW